MFQTIEEREEDNMATQPQDPKPAGGMALPGIGQDMQGNVETLKNSLVKLLLNEEINKLVGDSSSNHEAKSKHLTDALSISRDQEWHNFEMNNESELHKFKLATEAAKLANFRQKQEHDTFKIELAKQEAIAKGISVPSQDPKPVPPIPRTEWQDITTTLLNTPTSPGTLAPSLGVSGAQIAVTPDTNPLRAAFDAIHARRYEMQKQGQIPSTAAASDADKAHKAILEQLQVQLGKLDEKNLEYGPMGQPGQILGGLLDVISGPLDIGTMLFGGKPGPMQKAQLLINAANSVSPLVRAGLQDALGRDRMEMTAERYLASRGLGAHSSKLKDAMDFDTARLYESFGIDINNLLSTDQATATHFGSEATSGIGDAFRAFQNAVSAMQLIPIATSPEELASAEKRLTDADATMRQHFQRFLSNGGNEQQLEEVITNAEAAINAKFNAPLTYTPGDQRETQFNAHKKSATRAFTDELKQFYAVATGNIPIEKNVLNELKTVAKHGKEVAALMKQDLQVPPVFRRLKTPFGGMRKTVPMDKEDYAILVAEATGKVGHQPNKMAQKIRDIGMSAEDATLLENKLLSLAPEKNKKTIQRIFKEYKSSEWAKTPTSKQAAEWAIPPTRK